MSHNHHGECCSHDKDKCCNQENGNHNHSCHDHEHEDFAHHLLEMADEAWMEVLKEKIKEQIKSTGDSRLDTLAKIVADSNNDRWKHKLYSQKDCAQFKEKIQDFFNS